MKFLIVFSAVLVASIHAHVAFDRSLIEKTVLPFLPKVGYGDIDTLGYSVYHNQDIIGQYNFGYDTANNKRTEARDALGAVVGSYSYVDANGKLQTVNYRADENGFNAAGTIIPDASSVVADLEPVKETEEVMLARDAHLKAYEDFKAGIYELPVAPVVPEVPELIQIDDAPEVALAKKKFLETYDAHVELLKNLESGVQELSTLSPISVELPEPVTDEPHVALAKKEHNEIREALKEQHELLEKLRIESVVPVVREIDVIPSPVVEVDGKVHEVALTSPTYFPEVKTIVAEEKVNEPLITPPYPYFPYLPTASYISPSLKTVSPIVAEGQLHEPLVTPPYPYFPYLPTTSYISPSLKTVSPIVAEGQLHEPLVTSSYPYLPSLKTISHGLVSRARLPTSKEFIIYDY